MRATINFDSIQSFLKSIKTNFGQEIAFSQYSLDQWRFLSYFELYSNSYKVASYLNDYGIKKGDRVGVLMDSIIELPEIFLGIILSGAIIVPIDLNLTSSELLKILKHCSPKAIFYTFEHASNLKNSLSNSNLIVDCFYVKEGDPDYLKHPENKIYTPLNFSNENTSLIVYTSGTLGEPKGVMTSLKSLFFESRVSYVQENLDGKQRFLSILPKNHLFEITGGLFVNLCNGAEICYAREIEKDHIRFCLRERRITQMVTVPLFLSNIKKGIELQVKENSSLKQNMFSGMKSISPKLKREYRRKMFAKIHEAFGGHLVRFIVGGAPVGVDIIEFYESIGIEVFEGYGLSETGPIISVNLPDANFPGSVGTPLKGVEVKISKKNAKDSGGEILTRGPHIMNGYFNNLKLTNEVIDKEHWFHTGDYGYIDKDGFIFVTGRIKRMIVLDGGKNLHSEEVEQFLLQNENIGESCVLGLTEIFPDLGLSEKIIYIAYPNVEKFGELINIEVSDQISREIRNSMTGLSSYKRADLILVMGEELPKTTTMKVKALALAKKLAQVLENECERKEDITNQNVLKLLESGVRNSFKK